MSQEPFGKWEGNADNYGGGNRHPNFLQKLYDFLALEPHPCPEVIYWASDSRQLVIAQPERLTREVLPRLFKHDKLASFGRQLNIYGFSRLFPGRQFKDAKGEISDASVWAHPTLHRLSTSADIAAIKRRAAPKLFRTRRLANGQIIRSRAGPAVEAKAREVRETIAESRRQRGSITASTYLTPSGPDTHHHDVHPLGEHKGMNSALTFHGKSRLTDITEHMVHGASYERGHDTGDRRESIISIDNIFDSSSPNYHFPEQQDSNLASEYGNHELLTMPRLLPYDSRPFQSCPASIHTSPVPARMTIDPNDSRAGMNSAWTGFNGHGHEHNFPPLTSQGYPKQPLHMEIASQGMKIAQPAASNPFQETQNQSLTYQISPTTGSWSITPVSNSHTPITANGNGFENSQLNHHWMPSIDDGKGQYHHHHLQPSWEGQPQTPLSPPPPGTGTIDPRWVSPSVWTTPCGTRAPSPTENDQAHQPQFPNQTLGSHDMMQGPSSLETGLQSFYAPPTMENYRGTQSYPPRIIERRHLESSNASLLSDLMPQTHNQSRNDLSPDAISHLEYPNSRGNLAHDLEVRHVSFGHDPKPTGNEREEAIHGGGG